MDDWHEHLVAMAYLELNDEPIHVGGWFLGFLDSGIRIIHPTCVTQYSNIILYRVSDEDDEAIWLYDGTTIRIGGNKFKLSARLWGEITPFMFEGTKEDFA